MTTDTMLTSSVDRSQKPDDMRTIISYKPSTLETIDTAVYNWLRNDMKIACTTNKGWKPLPVVWVAGERSWQVKNNKNLRDSAGALIFPMMTLQRDNFSKDPAKKGVFYGNIPHINDPKGASITIARRVQQDKTANFANANAYRKASKLKGNAGNPGAQQINFPMPKNKQVVYETITIPMPVYIEVNYTISSRTEYQQQMNEILQPFATVTQGINYLVLKQDGHSYETFMQSDFSSDNNITELGDETRIYESKITLKVLGYLVGANKNDEQPHIVIRENAVDIKTPRERVVMGDEPDWGPIGNPPGKYRS